MVLHPDWKEFINLLNANEVEYLVVGAFALGFHGLPRLTDDIDFWINPSAENSAKLVKVLTSFGFPKTVTAEQFSKEDRILQLGMPPYRLDILTSLEGLTFENAWANRATGKLDGLSVNFISREDYLENKKKLARPKDIADANRLDETIK